MISDLRTTNAFFLYVAVLLYLSVGAATLPHLAWYSGLLSPSFSLSAGMVSVLWLVVFIAAAYSLMALWKSELPTRTRYVTAAAYGGIGFGLVLWNYLFFGARDLSTAAVVAVGITVATTLLVLALRRPAYRASLWLLPFLAWMLYATWFNLMLSSLNA